MAWGSRERNLVGGGLGSRGNFSRSQLVQVQLGLELEKRNLRLVQQEAFRKAKWGSLGVRRELLDYLGEIVKVEGEELSIYSSRNDCVVRYCNRTDIVRVHFACRVQDPARAVCMPQDSNSWVDAAGE